MEEIAAMNSETRTYRSFRQQGAHYFLERPHARLPDKAIESPAAWHGSDLREREAEWRLSLSDEEIDELEAVLSDLESRGVSLRDIGSASAPLERLGPRLAACRSTLTSGRGFVVLSGLPVEAWTEARSAMAFWLIGHHLGIPGAQNDEEELLGHVIDYGEQSTSPHVRLYRTPSEIGFHCDGADVVGLLCLTAAPSGGQSRIASSVAIFNALFEADPILALGLFEPFAVDRRGEQRPGQSGFYEIPPARFSEDGALRTFYHSEYFRSVARLPEVGPLAPERLRLLDRYDALACSAEFHLEMDLAPGDMQFISNHTVVHARTMYEDDRDPARKRHLLRLWLSLENRADA
jgi:hypothetical protein